MNTYQALKCLVDETANEEELKEARAEGRRFINALDEIEEMVTDPDSQPLDTFPLLSSVLTEEGVCVTVFCTAVDPRERLGQKSFGELARKLPNAKIIQKVIDTVKSRDGKLPPAFTEWRGTILWGAAQALVQEAANDWPEAAERRGRIITKKRDAGNQPEQGESDA
jgi:hypothetical protein